MKYPPINTAAVDFIYKHRCLIDYFGGTYSPSMISFVRIGSFPSHHACVGGVIRVPFRHQILIDRLEAVIWNAHSILRSAPRIGVEEVAEMPA